MNSANFKHFDKLSFVDEAKQVGADEKFARVIADRLEQIENHKNEDVATKSDLKDLELRMNDKIDRVSNKLITVISFVIVIATFIIKFH